MTKIPKIIHYCWVGGAPKPQSVQYCIDSWKKFCPDYEIKEWNESNYDFTKNQYMKQAYEAKKWGFVPDYARLDIVYKHGGIYLDTDVELIKSFDSLLDQDAFMGFEDTGDGEYFVNCGQGFGAIAHHEIIKKARDLYDHVSFLNSDGSCNLLASPHYTTQTLRNFGLMQENRNQQLLGMTVYASDVLCPKNFRTGKISITLNTVSIHHFTASWMDDKIKAEMDRQQRLEKYFGKKLTRVFLFTESVWKKYSGIKLITKLPKCFLSKVKIRLISLWESIPLYRELFLARFTSTGENSPILLDPALDGDNSGDQIIMENCLFQFPEGLTKDDTIHVPTHRKPTKKEQMQLLSARMKILCGTNALSGHMCSYGLWRMDRQIRIYRNTVLMGVGFDSNCEDFDFYTKALLKTILSKECLHSVRDSFSEGMLNNMGIHNVINTGCPTMWGLTSEVCASIPRNKATRVICTLTDYNKNPKLDQELLDVLSNCYTTVYLWPQGIEDNDYFQQLRINDNTVIVSSGLEAYDKLLSLDNIDYVGTRLHAGIRSLSQRHRTIIISIDNRAESIARDTGLPIIHREDIEIYLKDKIESAFVTDIRLPKDNIEKWKRQFNELLIDATRG